LLTSWPAATERTVSSQRSASEPTPAAARSCGHQFSLPLLASHGYQGTAWTVAGVRGQAQGNHHPSIAPYGLFRCGVETTLQQHDAPPLLGASNRTLGRET
jgi:hypothetical protein